MWDGSAIDLDENLQIAEELLEKTAAAKIVLELEIGVVGGEEDGVSADIDEKLYTAEGDFVATAKRSGWGSGASTCSPPPSATCTASTSRATSSCARRSSSRVRTSSRRSSAPPTTSRSTSVFHGGSGSAQSEIREALSYGVVKMNVDTDTQYAFTRPIVGHMFTNYDGVLKIDGEVGNKKAYDPRSYLKAAETAWPPASSRRARTCCPPASRRAA
jgi:fructose-bisphosphate aldolase class II